MNTIEILDCTLRDGAHVNGGHFGQQNIIDIATSLTRVGVDIIEVGFLDVRPYDINKTYFSDIDIARNLLVKNGLSLDAKTLLVRPDQYPAKLLTQSLENDFTLRLAFYEKDLSVTLDFADTAVGLGYNIALNPINSFGWSAENLIKLIISGNELEVMAFSIVDTFGSLDIFSLEHLTNLYLENITKGAKIGLHLHENLASSFTLAQLFIQKLHKKCSVIVDASLLGMGRVPGNLPTELIIFHLIEYYNKRYDFAASLQLVEEKIVHFKKNMDWGYDLHYAISGLRGLHRSYAEQLKDNNKEPSELYRLFNKLKNDNEKNYYDRNKFKNIL